jgi:SPP1 family predicted phage head-tail adaptor
MLDVLTLRSTVTTSGTNAENVQTVTSVDVFTEPKDVKRSEHYQAQAAGQRVDKVFEVNTDEYDGQKEAVYAGITYTITRSYSPGRGRTELICTRR